MKISYLIVTAVKFGTFVSGNRIWRHIGVIVHSRLSLIRGTTLHKWSAIGDGRYLNEEIVHLIKTDERFNDVKDNVQSTNTLIIEHLSNVNHDHPQAHLPLEAAVKNHRLKLLANFQIKLTNSLLSDK
jgi:hypothetical protein